MPTGRREPVTCGYWVVVLCRYSNPDQLHEQLSQLLAELEET